MNKQQSADEQIASRLARCVAAAEEERQTQGARQQRADTLRVSTHQGMQSALDATLRERERGVDYLRSERRQHERELAGQRQAYHERSHSVSARVRSTSSPRAIQHYKQEEVMRKHTAASAERARNRDFAARAIAVRAEEQMLKQKLHDKILLAKHGVL